MTKEGGKELDWPLGGEVATNQEGRFTNEYIHGASTHTLSIRASVGQMGAVRTQLETHSLGPCGWLWICHMYMLSSCGQI